MKFTRWEGANTKSKQTVFTIWDYLTFFQSIQFSLIMLKTERKKKRSQKSKKKKENENWLAWVFMLVIVFVQDDILKYV